MTQFKDQRDQKINYVDRARSKDQRSTCFTDQRIKDHPRSKIKKTTRDQKLSDHRSKVQGSLFHRSDH